MSLLRLLRALRTRRSWVYSPACVFSQKSFQRVHHPGRRLSIPGRLQCLSRVSWHPRAYKLREASSLGCIVVAWRIRHTVEGAALNARVCQMGSCTPPQTLLPSELPLPVSGHRNWSREWRLFVPVDVCVRHDRRLREQAVEMFERDLLSFTLGGLVSVVETVREWQKMH